MNKMRIAAALALIGLLRTLSAAPSSAEIECKQPKLKPLHRVGGRVIDRSGAPVPHATVTMFQEQKEVVATRTADDGTFQFPLVAAGKCKLQVHNSGFRAATFAIVIEKPEQKQKRKLEILLEVSGLETCPDSNIRERNQVPRR